MKSTRIALLWVGVLAGVSFAADGKGISATDAAGKPLNLGFEDGTLKDWTATGDAFGQQPIKGDTIAARINGVHSQHAGEYWIGGFEKLGDGATGTLTSVPFKVNHPWASFLAASGREQGTRIELVTADDNKVFYTISGLNIEELLPAVVDLKDVQGKSIFIRLVDEQKGGWGHVSFDDFLFYDQKPEFPKVLIPPPPADVVKFAGLPPERAAQEMTLPPGFHASVFAAEPDIINPIAFTIDARGRLWVVQGMTYPVRQPEGQGKDTILIFEDANGDGKFDKRTVFAEKLNLVSGIEVGFGGVWLGAAPNLMFIPDKNGDDKPDGPPQILLDGWAYEDTHETLNTFAWGPDGWLYGCHGVFTHSNVGKPGASDADRTKINAGIWRYHPTKHTFEVFAEGTSNPWGIDWDENGQLWEEACVIPHLWHMIQGGRYQRQAGQHFNPYTFDDIKQTADHVHYAGADGPHAANGRSDSAGGGHAHAGLMIYQGDQWPAEYRGKIFIGNIHGQRINMDVPEPKGSGYVGHHGADFINFNDKASQVVNFRQGPDGAVYFIDWYDINQCHNPDPKVHDQTTGRIYKVWYGDGATKNVNLADKSDRELIAAQAGANVTAARSARRLLQERAAAGAVKDPDAKAAIAALLQPGAGKVKNLNALWTLHAVGGLDEPSLAQLLDHVEPYVAAWSIQFLTEQKSALSQDMLGRLAGLAQKSNSPVVRLYLASAVQRLPIEQRWDIVAGLLTHAVEDKDDHNLPLMYWYALEPLAGADAPRALKLAIASKLPLLREYTVRRIAMGKPQAAASGASPAAAQISARKPIMATPQTVKSFFNGKDLTGWWGEKDVWSVDDGELVGKTATGLKENQFLKSDLLVGDFRLVCKVKLTPDSANSGIQFRSEPLPDSTEMRGYQADVGQGWWGKLYHESGRGLLWDKNPPEGTVKANEWNTYEVLAVGHKIQTCINGRLCVDLDDPQGELKGVIAVQVHAGGPTEVRFKDFELELDPKAELKTIQK